MVGTLDERTILPPREHLALDEMARVLAALPSRHRARLMAPDGTTLDLPEEVYHALRDVVEALSQGLAITIAPQNTMLTTQEAADLLNISRPTLVKLLQEGEIPYSRRGRHRRVLLRDVVDYQQHSRAQRRAGLDAMVADGEAAGLYDVVEPPGPTR
ncbi:excisionase family DNA binding protein [Stackebrandtia albiflava]|uniref:Excisionase family DNA binding protein n=1 Tax=Stackebrandtia albiflava TaxID=406432 RepID=A0A562URT8_9ACTN|nr:helix-turn-helix domain-containing protein [Stackebrandtia albiflava]TWJ08322.1 excisionase family DNA binding protein [Stackebrandtia albiflava]